jgi:hypothetical protein
MGDASSGDKTIWVATQNVRKKIKYWVDNQHLAMWCGPSSTWRQTQKLISAPSLTTKTTLLFFNRTLILDCYCLSRWT